MLRLSAIFLCIMCTSGCASTLGVIFDRPVSENTAEEQGVLTAFAMMADRRAVLVVTKGRDAGKFCAEPPPDTATAIKAQVLASIEAKAKSETARVDAEVKGSIDDKFETAVTILAERTAALDMFRTGVYAHCQYYLNGSIDAREIGPLFEKLIEGYKSSSANSSKKRESQTP